MSLVSITRVTTDPVADFDNLMQLAGLGDCVPLGSRILLKPNQHGGGGFTSPGVIRSAILWCKAQGAAEVWVGDGPYFGCEHFNDYTCETGMQEVCHETGALPLNFHEGDYEIIRPDSPNLPKTLGISRYLLEADAVINLALMKTHFNTLVTLGIKNLKGCIRPQDKRAMHELELNSAIADLAAILNPYITATVIDATTAFEGMGPAAATPVEMGLLLASRDMVAVDTIATGLMGIDPAQARKIRFAADRGVGVTDLDKIEVVGENPADHRRTFKLPYEALLEDFPTLTLQSEGACSGCSLNLARALEIAKSSGQELTCETVILGPSVMTEGQVLLVGQCTRKGWANVAHVKGCPPSVDAIREALTGIENDGSLPKT